MDVKDLCDGRFIGKPVTIVGKTLTIIGGKKTADEILAEMESISLTGEVLKLKAIVPSQKFVELSLSSGKARLTQYPDRIEICSGSVCWNLY